MSKNNQKTSEAYDKVISALAEQDSVVNRQEPVQKKQEVPKQEQEKQEEKVDKSVVDSLLKKEETDELSYEELYNLKPEDAPLDVLINTSSNVCITNDKDGSTRTLMSGERMQNKFIADIVKKESRGSGRYGSLAIFAVIDSAQANTLEENRRKAMGFDTPELIKEIQKRKKDTIDPNIQRIIDKKKSDIGYEKRNKEIWAASAALSSKKT